MKTNKLFGTAALIISIMLAFGFTACDDPNSGGGAPVITTTTLPGGTVGTPYSQTLKATGDAPITWSVESGELPGGLSLTAGVIAGTPTTADTFNFTVKAENAAGSSTKALSIVIAASTVINIQAIAGVTKPVQGATPVTAITANDQYTGAVTWNHSPVTFDYATEYVATITLAAKSGYTLLGVSANFFTVAGADLVTNAANSGVVTATFPQTADDPSLLHLEGDVTISPDTNVTTGTELTAEYTGTEDITITSWQWEKDGVDVGANSNKYTPTEEGTYTVTLRAEGYNPLTSDPVIVTFPTFTTAAALTAYLNSQPANTADTPYNIKLNVNTPNAPWTTYGAAKTAFNDKFVNLDLSGSTFTSFNVNAFDDCTLLTGVTIPASVTTIADGGGYGSFRGCTNLTSVTFAEGSQLTNIGAAAFQNCTSLVSVTIPASVTTIGNNAFQGCTGLTDITIPEGVTSIGNFAFRDCTGLTGTLTIPSSVTSFGNNAFQGCTGLTSVTISEGVTTIGQSAFNGCTGLTSITIPNSVTTIGASAFNGCTGLTGTLTIPVGVTSFGASAFRGCTGLTAITIPASVTTIGNFAFYGCTGITGTLTIPVGVTSIGNEAFYGCTGITGITIPASVTSIGSSVFQNCTSLTSVTFAGTIASGSFNTTQSVGDLRTKFYTGDSANGVPGTYTRPNGTGTTWTKQP